MLNPLFSKFSSLRFRNLFLVLVLVVGFFNLFLQLTIAEQPPAEWIVSAEAAGMINPIPSEKKSIKKGKKLYRQWCLTCHGTRGKGDGPSALSQEIFPRDLSDPQLWTQGEGAIFWKISEGRTPMPNFKDYLPENQRWHIVNYLQTLSSSGKN